MKGSSGGVFGVLESALATMGARKKEVGAWRIYIKPVAPNGETVWNGKQRMNVDCCSVLYPHAFTYIFLLCKKGTRYRELRE